MPPLTNFFRQSSSLISEHNPLNPDSVDVQPSASSAAAQQHAIANNLAQQAHAQQQYHYSYTIGQIANLWPLPAGMYWNNAGQIQGWPIPDPEAVWVTRTVGNGQVYTEMIPGLKMSTLEAAHKENLEFDARNKQETESHRIQMMFSDDRFGTRHE